MEKVEGCKKAKDRKEALKEVGLTVSPTTVKRVQKFKSSPSCHQDEGCSLLRNLFEFVSHGTLDDHMVEGLLLKRTKKTDL